MMTYFKRQLWRGRLYATGDMFAKLEALRDAARLSGKEIEVLQRERLRALLVHAWENVPYYRHTFEEAGLRPDTATVEDLRRLPLLDKETIREHWETLKSKDLDRRKWKVNTSGGSTGEPGRFVQDAEFHRWTVAVKLLFDEWSGVRLGDKRALLWGSERDLMVGRETFKMRFSRWLRNELTLNAFRMTESTMAQYIEQLNAFRPDQILAYAESMDELARYVESRGLEVHTPKSIMTSAGTLFDHMRERIERVFGCSVFNRYGSREVGDIACEDASHQGLRVSTLTHLVELLGPDGAPVRPGEPGEVVITLLTNYAMPLIRYRIGDMAVGCKSGAQVVLAEVTGRVSDYFTLRNGERIRVPTALFAQEPWIAKYQVIQEDFDHVRVLVVRSTFSLGSRELEAAKKAMLGKLGRILRVDKIFIEEVPEIPPTASGKYRYTISKVASQAVTRRNEHAQAPL